MERAKQLLQPLAGGYNHEIATRDHIQILFYIVECTNDWTERQAILQHCNEMITCVGVGNTSVEFPASPAARSTSGIQTRDELLAIVKELKPSERLPTPFGMNMKGKELHEKLGEWFTKYYDYHNFSKSHVEAYDSADSAYHIEEKFMSIIEDLRTVDKLICADDGPKNTGPVTAGIRVFVSDMRLLSQKLRLRLTISKMA